MKPFLCPTCNRGFKSEQALGDHGRDSHGITAPRIIASAPDAVCMECGAVAKLVNGEAIYPHRPDLYAKRFWLCPCGAYCGCHGFTTRPLGSPCGPETRRARQNAHDVFDRLWRSGEMDRRGAYTWLSNAMGLPSEQTHIGMMTRLQAIKVVQHCRARSLPKQKVQVDG